MECDVVDEDDRVYSGLGSRDSGLKNHRTASPLGRWADSWTDNLKDLATARSLCHAKSCGRPAAVPRPSTRQRPGDATGKGKGVWGNGRIMVKRGEALAGPSINCKTIFNNSTQQGCCCMESWGLSDYLPSTFDTTLKEMAKEILGRKKKIK